MDSHDPFDPIPPHDWLYPLYLNKEKIDLILSSIPTVMNPITAKRSQGNSCNNFQPKAVRGLGREHTDSESGVTSPQSKLNDTEDLMCATSSIPPPPKAISVTGVGNADNMNIYRMKQPIIEPIRISSKTSILPGKPGILHPNHCGKSSKYDAEPTSFPNSSPPSQPQSICPTAAVEAVRQALSVQKGGRVILMTSNNATKGIVNFYRTYIVHACL